jgi:hypothetical protein
MPWTATDHHGCGRVLAHRHDRIVDPALLRGRRHDGAAEGPSTTPTGVAIFAYDFQSIRKFADRDHANIISWNRYGTGSQFATRDAPDVLVSDIRNFFRPLR